VTLRELGLGFLIAAAVAFLAYRAGSLTRAGAAAAVVVGGLTFGAGGMLAGSLLLLFFISSSALSRLGFRRKAHVEERFEKVGRRDHAQVFANGGVAALLAAGYGLTAEPVLLIALAGSLAAVNADTWATELGVLSRRRPRLITSGRPVEAGTSGAVSIEGTLAAAAGAGLIAVVAGLASSSAGIAVAVLAGGFTGAAVDSLLGASAQAIYFCPACHKETERHPRHTCGTPTTLVRGWPWLRNDAVNLACSIVGGLGAAAIWTLFN
jgi:uncharacterized protein (TIGR00297 family)